MNKITNKLTGEEATFGQLYVNSGWAYDPGIADEGDYVFEYSTEKGFGRKTYKTLKEFHNEWGE